MPTHLGRGERLSDGSRKPSGLAIIPVGTEVCGKTITWTVRCKYRSQLTDWRSGSSLMYHTYLRFLTNVRVQWDIITNMTNALSFSFKWVRWSGLIAGLLTTCVITLCKTVTFLRWSALNVFTNLSNDVEYDVNLTHREGGQNYNNKRKDLFLKGRETV